MAIGDAVKYEGVHASEHEIVFNEGPAPSKRSGSWLPRGKRRTLGLGVLAAVVVLVVNLGILAWTLKQGQQGAQGITTVYTGSCTLVDNVSTWGHLGINILGSLLLAASNQCMQYLAAPTRRDVDEAHAKHRWLDIGVHSLRNFTSMSFARRMLWLLLAVSSVPLHLLYNSVLLESKVQTNYAVATVSQDFIHGGAWNRTAFQNRCYDIPLVDTIESDLSGTVQFLQEHQSDLIRLGSSDCIQAYSQTPLQHYGNLLVVTSASNNNNSVLNLNYVNEESELAAWGTPGLWMCASLAQPLPSSCDSGSLLANAASWAVPGTLHSDINATGYTPSGPQVQTEGTCNYSPDQTFPVEYCLAQSVPDACSVAVSLPILAVLLICNGVKVVCLLSTLLGFAGARPLLTLGDAIASFLQHPDDTTVGFGTLEARKASHGFKWRPQGRPWQDRTRRGFNAASPTRWILSSLLFIIAWVICIALLVAGLHAYTARNLSTSWSSLVGYGLGHYNTQQIDGAGGDPDGDTDIGVKVFLANLPQLLISVLYLLYNDLFTRLHLSREWTSYATNRKALRATQPEGAQRGTYYLSLPMKISLPLLAAMAVLHWLISQSIFLGYMTGQDYGLGGGTPMPLGPVLLNVGWSPFGLVLSLIAGAVLVLSLWAAALLFRYNKGIPIVRSCSVAISAACHRPGWDVDAALEPIMYGELSTEDGVKGQDHPRVGFSSGPVQPLVTGTIYSS